jgi:hypothetical protein
MLNSTLGHLYVLQSENKLLQITVHTATDGLKILKNQDEKEGYQSYSFKYFRVTLRSCITVQGRLSSTVIT